MKLCLILFSVILMISMILSCSKHQKNIQLIKSSTRCYKDSDRISFDYIYDYHDVENYELRLLSDLCTQNHHLIIFGPCTNNIILDFNIILLRTLDMCNDNLKYYKTQNLNITQQNRFTKYLIQRSFETVLLDYKSKIILMTNINEIDSTNDLKDEVNKLPVRYDNEKIIYHIVKSKPKNPLILMDTNN